jgi:hypothetical protein
MEKQTCSERVSVLRADEWPDVACGLVLANMNRERRLRFLLSRISDSNQIAIVEWLRGTFPVISRD